MKLVFSEIKTYRNKRKKRHKIPVGEKKDFSRRWYNFLPIFEELFSEHVLYL